MSDGSDTDAAEALRAAVERVESIRAELDAEGLDRSALDTVADAYRSVEAILDRWEDRATDWDDFEGYVEFRNDLAGTLESLPEDLPERDAFVEADGCVKTGGVSKSLDAGDFEDAREALAPAAAYAELRTDLESAIEDRRAARKRARRRRATLRERISELERILELGEADLDAPIDRLEDPIRTYNDRVTEAFRTFRREAAAETFLGFVDRAAHTPFVAYEPPPAALLEYVGSGAAGEHPIDELLEYADYSRSKLSHYVDDADLLKRRVATNRTYLERLSAEPLAVAWPPEPADELRFRTEELLGLVRRIAGEETAATLREVRALTRRDDYARLRAAARAEAALTDDQRRRLEAGEIDAELSAAREEFERLGAELDG